MSLPRFVTNQAACAPALALPLLVWHSMAAALIALGANLGDRARTLARALELLQSPRTAVIRHSTWLETRPVGGPAHQPPYLNGAALVETTLSAAELAAHLREVEAALGRRREQRWGARTIDLDLLAYDQLQCETPELTLPHPRLAFRRFVLQPATEIAPQMVVPGSGLTIAQLLRRLDDLPNVVSVSAGEPLSAREIARATSARLSALGISAEVLFPTSSCGDTLACNPSGRRGEVFLEWLLAWRETLAAKAKPSPSEQWLLFVAELAWLRDAPRVLSDEELARIEANVRGFRPLAGVKVPVLVHCPATAGPPSWQATCRLVEAAMAPALAIRPWGGDLASAVEEITGAVLGTMPLDWPQAASSSEEVCHRAVE